MSIALEELIRQITESGIIAPGKLERFVPPKAYPQSVEELIRTLCCENLLTGYQAQQVAAGNAKTLNLGSYSILDTIGVGGMGQVFKAEHRHLKRVVAIKTLHSDSMQNPERIARFQREVKAAAKLRHPNIVATDDANEFAGVHFLVMEYVEGQDLSALVKKEGPLPVATAVNYIIQAARGLDFAHKNGIVHRDIKPSNLLLDSGDTVKVLDMGLARIETDANDTTQYELTDTGAIIGTVNYMAPEQAINAQGADARADIYSLGCTLYYLLAARPMYDGRTVIEKVMAHRERPIPSLRDVRTDIDQHLETVFQKMVAKRVKDRHQTVTEVIVDLEEFSSRQTTLRMSPKSNDTDFKIEPTAQMKGGDAVAKQFAGDRKLTLLIAASVGTFVLVAVCVSFWNKGSGEQNGTQVLTGQVISQKTGPAAESPRTHFPFGTPGFNQWVKDVAASPAEEQVKTVVKRLRELNPEFDGTEHHTTEKNVVTEFGVVTSKITDISPVRAFKDVASLRLRGSFPVTSTFSDLSPLAKMQLLSLDCGLSQVSDLSPLRGMPLRKLDCSGTQVVDLSPLQGMLLTELRCSGCPELSDLTPLKEAPLRILDCYATKIATLAPLKSMELTFLDFGGTLVTDLSPLKGMPLTELRCWGTQVRDLSPIEGISLTRLECQGTPASDLSPLKSMPLKFLNCADTNVSNLSPLAGLSLEVVYLTPGKITEGMDAIRQMKSLKTIGLHNDQYFSSDDFWKKYDAGVFGKPTNSKSAAPE